MTEQTVELRIIGGMLLVNGRPATADEARAFRRFIDQVETCPEDEVGAKRCLDRLYATCGSPSGGLLIKTEEALDIQN